MCFGNSTNFEGILIVSSLVYKIGLKMCRWVTKSLTVSYMCYEGFFKLLFVMGIYVIGIVAYTFQIILFTQYTHFHDFLVFSEDRNPRWPTPNYIMRKPKTYPLGGGWGERTRTLVPWRQGFKHPTRNECMCWFALILGGEVEPLKRATSLHIP